MSNINIVDVIAQRLKSEPIGSLIKDEDVYDIVKQAMAKAFLEPISEKVGYQTVTHDNQVVKLVREHLHVALQSAVNKWVAENGEKLMQAAVKTLGDNTEALMIKTLAGVLANPRDSAIHELVEHINELRERFDMVPLQRVEYR